MPREFNGKQYYKTTEVCESVGISRPTLSRWLKRGLLPMVFRDRRGWRLFTKEDLNTIREEANKVEIEYIPDRSKNK